MTGKRFCAGKRALLLQNVLKLISQEISVDPAPHNVWSRPVVCRGDAVGVGSLCWLRARRLCRIFGMCRMKGEEKGGERGKRHWGENEKNTRREPVWVRKRWQRPRQDGIQRRIEISHSNLVCYYSLGTSAGMKTAIHHSGNTVT